MNVKPNNIFFFALAIYFLNNLEWQVWNKSLSPVIMYKVKYPLSLVYLFSTSNAFSRTWINVLVHDMIAIASHEFSQPRGSTLVEWSHLRMTGYEVPMQSLGDKGLLYELQVSTTPEVSVTFATHVSVSIWFRF